MSSTTGQIKKLQEQLQKLRRDFIKAADAEEQAMISNRISYHVKALRELGVGV